MIRLKPIRLPCGGVAQFDEVAGPATEAGYGYRCEDCMAVIGSVGQSQRCKEEAEKYFNWEKIGGTGWDYTKGEPKQRKAVNAD
jgi:hypothetical protein